MDLRKSRILALVGFILFFVTASGAGFLGYQLVTFNKKKATELSEALSNKEKQLKKDFQAEKERVNTSFVADEIFGNFEFTYPKIWSTNVKQEQGAIEELVFLADPELINVNKDKPGPYTALRVQVYNQKYDIKLKDLQNKNKNNKAALKEEDATVSGISGKRFIGKDAKTGLNLNYIVLPIRDKTLYIGTDDGVNQLENFEKILKTFKISK
jgi:hypothetical protein